jgi:hypothetical protein
MKGIMHRRHGIMALLTLIALAVSFTGTAFASACAAPSGVSHAQHEGMPEQPTPDHDSEPSVPGCPMALAAGCATAPSLTANVSITFAVAPEVLIAAVTSDDALDHIRTSIIFHPPRF